MRVHLFLLLRFLVGTGVDSDLIFCARYAELWSAFYEGVKPRYITLKH